MNIFDAVVQKSGLSVQLILKDHLEDNVGGAVFFLHNNSIEIGTETIVKSASHLSKEFNMDVTPEALGEIIISHELGHANHKELPSIREELNKQLKLSWEMSSSLNERGIKPLYRKVCSLVMEKEIAAWDLAPSFFINPINQQLLETYREHCLDSYRTMLLDEFKCLIILAKLGQKLDVYESAYPSDICFDVDTKSVFSSIYDEEGKRFIIHLNHYFRCKNDAYKNLSTVDFVLFEIVQQFISLKYTERKKIITGYEMSAYRLITENKERMMENLLLYEKEHTTLTNLILDEMQEHMETHPQFNLYRSIVTNQMKNYIKMSYDHCFWKSDKNKNKETA